MPVGYAELAPVAIRHSARRGLTKTDIAINPSPDWCDDDSPPHVVGVVIDLPPETQEAPAPVSLPAAPAEPAPAEAVPVPQRGGLPLPAVVFLALLVAGYAAGFGIGLFGRP